MMWGGKGGGVVNWRRRVSEREATDLSVIDLSSLSDVPLAAPRSCTTTLSLSATQAYLRSVRASRIVRPGRTACG